ncbi:MAG: glycosyltransferase family 2 protein [bacterium]
MTNKLLSIIVPVYNEAKTLSEIINKLLILKLPANYQKEIIILDDCSKDHSEAIANSLVKLHPEISLYKNAANLGKSQTVKHGIMHSKGDFVIIQDADLEYFPSEIPLLLQLALDQQLDVVYGNRFGKKNTVIYWKNYWGNKMISLFSNLFTYPRLKIYIPDMEVCYKLISGEIARTLAPQIVSQTNFGFEPEITAKLSRYLQNEKHLHFAITPISYQPRTVAEGKHMKAFRDGFKAVGEIIRFNLL